LAALSERYQSLTDEQRYRDLLHTPRKSCIDDWAKASYPANGGRDRAGRADIKTTLDYYEQID